jgi:hypothetical protein
MNSLLKSPNCFSNQSHTNYVTFVTTIHHAAKLQWIHYQDEIITVRGRSLLLTVVITGIVILAIAACTPVPVIGGWVGSIFGVYIYQRFDKTTKTTPKSGAIIGVLSGLSAGIVLNFSVTVFSDAEVVLEDWPVLMLFTLAIYSFASAIGGAIGGAIFKPKIVGTEPTTAQIPGSDDTPQLQDLDGTPQVQGLDDTPQIQGSDDTPQIQEGSERFRVGLIAGLVTSVFLVPVTALEAYSIATGRPFGSFGDSIVGFCMLELFCLTVPVGTIGGGLGGRYFFPSREKSSWVVGAGMLGGVLAVIAVHVLVAFFLLGGL